MRNPTSIRDSSLKFLALSLAFHLLLSTLSFLPSARPKVSTVQAETKYYPAALYFPGGTRAKWAPQPPGRKRHPVADNRKRTSDLALSAKPAPAAGQPVAAMHEPVPGNGSDAESADPAFPVFSPHPPVADRSLLPSEQQQVVVDVKVSAAGDVLEATLVKGIGNGLDQIVMDTVKTWRFHPAMLNGSPVATEAELIFPFDQRYPMAPS
ncbi:MAG TPA: TonB family protein [Terracidiphilus sp.]|jgi:TonB family protein